MPGLPGARKGGRPAPVQRKKSKSGNPAKRAADERAAAERAAGARTAAAGKAFGMPSGGDDAGLPDLDPASLPKGFEKFLGR
jgi:signal recognition particle subunit SRP54